MEEKKRFLDLWTAEKINYEDNNAELTRAAIDEYTESKLWETIEYAAANSPFYMRKLRKYLPQVFLERSLAEDSPEEYSSAGARFQKALSHIPFTAEGELCGGGPEFSCVSHDKISRIVTQNTSGSTGEPKRIYFTEEDQQLTIDYFKNGMQLIADSSDVVLILMPADVTGSIGRLLAEGLEGFGAKAIAYGLPKLGKEAGQEAAVNPWLTKKERKEKKAQLKKAGKQVSAAGEILQLIEKEKVTCVVALPTHMRILAEECIRLAEGKAVDAGIEKVPELRSVLLSAEYVADEDVSLIEDTFGCKVYEHYGMTEMGLGCAVSCGCGEGYHIREADLYIEIIDPKTGENIEDDRTGEIVFTTLTRTGMPFIRYRTGDYSHWILDECPCGSVLKRLAKVEARKEIKGYL